jgi:phosphate acetyltransferase
MFLEIMRSKVRAKGKRIVYPEGLEERAVQAAARVRDQNWAKPILLGARADIEKVARAQKLNLDGITTIDTSIDTDFQSYVDEYYELRKHKGISKEEALQKVTQPHYFGALMVRRGQADGMVSGLNSDTKPFIPAFEIIKLKEGFKRASSMFVLEWPERLLFFADCAVNIDPDAQTLSDIAHATAQTVRSFGYEPRIAFLSFSTRDSAKSPLVDKMKEATRLARIDCPDTIIDGEVQFDAALLPEVARKKGKDSPFVEYGANVFIFPDLNCGNIAYKISERLGKAIATGPILQGLNKPVNDISRGGSFEDLANVTVLTAAAAVMKDEPPPMVCPLTLEET